MYPKEIVGFELLTCCIFASGNQALREAFRIFDKDKSGYIEAREIALTAQALGEALSEAELREFMAEADLDGDGRLNYNEFVKIMTSKGDDWSR